MSTRLNILLVGKVALGAKSFSHFEAYIKNTTFGRNYLRSSRFLCLRGLNIFTIFSNIHIL